MRKSKKSSTDKFYIERNALFKCYYLCQIPDLPGSVLIRSSWRRKIRSATRWCFLSVLAPRLHCAFLDFDADSRDCGKRILFFTIFFVFWQSQILYFDLDVAANGNFEPAVFSVHIRRSASTWCFGVRIFVANCCYCTSFWSLREFIMMQTKSSVNFW